MLAERRACRPGTRTSRAPLRQRAPDLEAWRRRTRAGRAGRTTSSRRRSARHSQSALDQAHDALVDHATRPSASRSSPRCKSRRRARPPSDRSSPRRTRPRRRSTRDPRAREIDQPEAGEGGRPGRAPPRPAPPRAAPGVGQHPGKAARRACSGVPRAAGAAGLEARRASPPPSRGSAARSRPTGVSGPTPALRRAMGASRFAGRRALGRSARALARGSGPPRRTRELLAGGPRRGVDARVARIVGRGVVPPDEAPAPLLLAVSSGKLPQAPAAGFSTAPSSRSRRRPSHPRDGRRRRRDRSRTPGCRRSPAGRPPASASVRSNFGVRCSTADPPPLQAGERDRLARGRVLRSANITWKSGERPMSRSGSSSSHHARRARPWWA